MDKNSLNLRRLKINRGSYSKFSPGYPKSLTKKWMRQRVTRGFSDFDAFDLDYFYLQLIPASLRHLAKNCHGWPDSIAETYEDWIKILNNLADDFDKLREMFDSDELYRGENNYEEFKTLRIDVFKRFGDIFFSLWD